MIWWHSANRDVLPGRFQPYGANCNSFQFHLQISSAWHAHSPHHLYVFWYMYISLVEVEFLINFVNYYASITSGFILPEIWKWFEIFAVYQFINPHQTGVSDSLIRRGGQMAPPRYWPNNGFCKVCFYRGLDIRGPLLLNWSLENFLKIREICRKSTKIAIWKKVFSNFIRPPGFNRER